MKKLTSVQININAIKMEVDGESINVFQVFDNFLDEDVDEVTIFNSIYENTNKLFSPVIELSFMYPPVDEAEDLFAKYFQKPVSQIILLQNRNKVVKNPALNPPIGEEYIADGTDFFISGILKNPQIIHQRSFDETKRNIRIRSNDIIAYAIS